MRAIGKKVVPPDYYPLQVSLYSRLAAPRITPLPKFSCCFFQLRERLAFFEAAQYFLQVNEIEGVYLEFGCHEANTFRMALNTLGSYALPNRIPHFYAFDSFEGMPTPEGIDKQKIWKAGMNFTSEERLLRLCRADRHRITTVKGFYEKSLRGYRLPEGHKAAMAYLDCDYYSSTSECLSFLEKHLRHGMILAFDDWNCYYADPKRGQRKAFEEYRARLSGRFSFEKFYDIKTGGTSFIVQENSLIGTDID